MIEIKEEKIDTVMEHIGKSIKCLTKVAECLEEMKDGGYEDDDEDFEVPKFAMGGRGMYRNGGRSRYANGGRYGRY